MFKLLAVLALAASSVQALTVASPPSMVQCQPTKLSWQDGKAPYFVSIIPGGQAGANALKDFGAQNGQDLVWTVDLPPGAITIKVSDTNGDIQYSSPINITPGSDTKCLNAGEANVSSGAGGGAAPSGGAGGSSDAAPSASGGASPSAGGGASPSSSHSGDAAAKPSSAAPPAGSSAAPKPAGSAAGLTASVGVVAAAGVVALAAF